MAFPENIDLLIKRKQNGLCPLCGEKPDLNALVSEADKAEYAISGLCKKCQDAFFVPELEEGDQEDG